MSRAKEEMTMPIYLEEKDLNDELAGLEDRAGERDNGEERGIG